MLNYSITKLLQVAADMMRLCRFTYLESGEPVSYHELGLSKQGIGSYTSYISLCVTTVMKVRSSIELSRRVSQSCSPLTIQEVRWQFKEWSHFGSLRGVEISHYPVNDGIPLYLWRGVVSIPAPPEAILKKLWKQRCACL